MPSPAMATILPMPPIDIAQSLDNLKLERDAIALYDALAGDREGSAPRRGVPDDRRQRAAPRRGLGRQAPGARCGRPRAERPAAPDPDDRAHRAAVRDACGSRPGPGARGRRGGPVHRPELARGRGDRRRRARARRDLAATERRAADPGTRSRVRATSRRASAGTGPAGRGRCARSSSASRTGSSRISPS